MNTPERRPRRAAYALPTLFTAGNVYLGFYALLEIFRGAMETVSAVNGAQLHFRTAAIAIAGVLFALDGVPLRSWVLSGAWVALMAFLSFLMVSTWRYPSFKDLSLTRPRSPLTFVLLGSLIYLIWNYSRPVLLALAVAYM